MARNAPPPRDGHPALRLEAVRGEQGVEPPEGFHAVGEEAFDGYVDAREGLRRENSQEGIP